MSRIAEMNSDLRNSASGNIIISNTSTTSFTFMLSPQPALWQWNAFLIHQTRRQVHLIDLSLESVSHPKATQTPPHPRLVPGKRKTPNLTTNIICTAVVTTTDIMLAKPSNRFNQQYSSRIPFPSKNLSAEAIIQAIALAPPLRETRTPRIRHLRRTSNNSSNSNSRINHNNSSSSKISTHSNRIRRTRPATTMR